MEVEPEEVDMEQDIPEESKKSKQQSVWPNIYPLCLFLLYLRLEKTYYIYLSSQICIYVIGI